MSEYTSLLPSSGVLMTDLTVETMPAYTYAMHIEAQSIHGMTDEREAMRQAIYKIIRTQRYRYPVYSWDYGIELLDLFGKPTPYVEVELKRRIKEALEWDDRIELVDSFVFGYPDRYTVRVAFTAHTIFGEVDIDNDFSQLDASTTTDLYWYVDGTTLTASWRAIASVKSKRLYMPAPDQQVVSGTCLIISEE